MKKKKKGTGFVLGISRLDKLFKSLNINPKLWTVYSIKTDTDSMNRLIYIGVEIYGPERPGRIASVARLKQ